MTREETIKTIVLCVVVVIVIVVGVRNWLLTNPFGTPFEQRAAFVEQCVNSGEYTRDECIELAGDTIAR